MSNSSGSKRPITKKDKGISICIMIAVAVFVVFLLVTCTKEDGEKAQTAANNSTATEQITQSNERTVDTGPESANLSDSPTTLRGNPIVVYPEGMYEVGVVDYTKEMSQEVWQYVAQTCTAFYMYNHKEAMCIDAFDNNSIIHSFNVNLEDLPDTVSVNAGGHVLNNKTTLQDLIDYYNLTPNENDPDEYVGKVDKFEATAKYYPDEKITNLYLWISSPRHDHTGQKYVEGYGYVDEVH